MEEMPVPNQPEVDGVVDLPDPVELGGILTNGRDAWF